MQDQQFEVLVVSRDVMVRLGNLRSEGVIYSIGNNGEKRRPGFSKFEKRGARLRTNRSFLNLVCADTIAAVKSSIEEMTGVLNERIQIYSSPAEGESALENERTLRECEVTDHQIVYMRVEETVSHRFSLQKY